MAREGWDTYYMRIANEVKTRSTCTRRQVGAVAVDTRHRVITTGYNGAPSGMAHCTEESCIRRQMNIPSGQQLDLCKAIHAEGNIVLEAGSRLKEATIYCTNQPCTSCFKLLFGAGVNRIAWQEYYPDPYASTLMLEWGIPIIKHGLIQLLSKTFLLEHYSLKGDAIDWFEKYSISVLTGSIESFTIENSMNSIIDGYRQFRNTPDGSKIQLNTWDWILAFDEIKQAIQTHSESQPVIDIIHGEHSQSSIAYLNSIVQKKLTEISIRK